MVGGTTKNIAGKVSSDQNELQVVRSEEGVPDRKSLAAGEAPVRIRKRSSTLEMANESKLLQWGWLVAWSNT